MNRMILSAALVFTFFGLGAVCEPCTTFVLRDEGVVLFGQNFDWYWSDGLVIVNQRGIAKTALGSPRGKPANWVSKYGSVTFNTLGRETAVGGMNEAGLVVGGMMLYGTKYPEADDRSAILLAQWLQYQLDNCRSVEEVLATDKLIRITTDSGIAFGVHFLVCDASGDTATIEFLGGKMVYHRGNSLPVRALTNHPYEDSLKFLNRGEGEQGDLGSLDRFACAETRSKEFRSKSASEDIDFAFGTLRDVRYRDVSLGDLTQWSIVYDVLNRRVYYRTHENDSLRWISLKDCGFSPGSLPSYVHVNAAGSGDVVGRLQTLTEERHKEFLLGFIGKETVKEKLGVDLTQTLDVFLEELRAYHPAK